jgi:pimeloyl-ACP methyl ester carboxylesterase
MKKLLTLLLTTLVIFSCDNEKSKPVTTEEKQNIKVELQNTTGYAPVNGLQMYYEIRGNGEPLVLIHGGGSTMQTTFGNILPLLAQHHKVIAMELQAHGHTRDRDTPESFQQDAADVVALLSFLKISKADILGFSNGGQTAMQIGISYPQAVKKLVIVSAFYKRDGATKGFFEGMNNANLGNMPGPLKEAYLEINNDSAGLQTMFERDKTRMLQFKDWRDEDIASIKAPTLIIAGDKDVVTTEHAVKMSRLIAGAELMIVPGTHGSFIGEVCSTTKGSKLPELTVAAIEEFLAK